jgi:hypothetical protein
VKESATLNRDLQPALLHRNQQSRAKYCRYSPEKASKRKALDVLRLLVELEPDFQAPAGLQVDVRVKVRVEHGAVAHQRQ